MANDAGGINLLRIAAGRQLQCYLPHFHSGQFLITDDFPKMESVFTEMNNNTAITGTKHNCKRSSKKVST
jgi:hypothetical protein